jgi:hypothetical protein
MVAAHLTDLKKDRVIEMAGGPYHFEANPYSFICSKKWSINASRDETIQPQMWRALFKAEKQNTKNYVTSPRDVLNAQCKDK